MNDFRLTEQWPGYYTFQYGAKTMHVEAAKRDEQSGWIIRRTQGGPEVLFAEGIPENAVSAYFARKERL
jgi:hypothetical protein